MKLVASPLLEEEDVEAFKKGYKSRSSIVERAVARQLDECRIQSLTKSRAIGLSALLGWWERDASTSSLQCQPENY